MNLWIFKENTSKEYLYYTMWKNEIHNSMYFLYLMTLISVAEIVSFKEWTVRLQVGYVQHCWTLLNHVYDFSPVSSLLRILLGQTYPIN
jgi:hypothetical protein